MSEDKLRETMVSILAGLLANPNVVTVCPNYGWRICNTDERQLTQYAYEFAMHVEDAISRNNQSANSQIQDDCNGKWLECTYYSPPQNVVVLTKAKNLNGDWIYKRLKQIFNRWETEDGILYVPLYEPTHWFKPEDGA